MPFTQQTFEIYSDEFLGRLNETIMQNTNAFNAASANALQLIPSLHRGNFAAESFFQEIAGLIRHRDVTSIAADTDDDLTQDELIMPKVNRKYQVAKTRDAWMKILPAGSAPGEFAARLGEQVAVARVADYLNTAITALVGATDGNADITFDTSGGSPNTTTYESLISALGKFGDASSTIAAWVMHGKVWHDLLGQSVGIVTDRVAGAVIYEGIAGTLGKPAVVTDSPALVIGDDSPGDAKYRTFGLVTGAVSVLESESNSDMPVVDWVTGLKNLLIRIQGENAYNLRIKGYSYTNAGINPTNAQLADDARWTTVASDKKSTAGVLLISR